MSKRRSQTPADVISAKGFTTTRVLFIFRSEIQVRVLCQAPLIGNIQYDLYQSPNKKNEFMRLEVWQTAQALEDHKATPHIKASFDKREKQGWKTKIIPWKRVAEDVK